MESKVVPPRFRDQTEQKSVKKPPRNSQKDALVSPQPAPPVYVCPRCGQTYKTQRSNFASSFSPLWRYNDWHLPICSFCLDELFRHYKMALKDERDAVFRICMKFDIYWSETLYYRVCERKTTSVSRIRAYINMLNASAMKDKTFDDSLDETEFATVDQKAEYANMKEEVQKLREELDHYKIDEANRIAIYGKAMEESGAEQAVVDPELIKFWGPGYPALAYPDLQNRFLRWTTGENACECVDPAQESLLKQICILEWRIQQNSVDNSKKISDDITVYNNLLGSASLKPSQKKAEEKSASTQELLTFGTGIKEWENDRPIPEPDPAFQDYDGIAKYISIWFLGHLCKMLKLKNTYSRLYEAEIEKLRVERPQYDDEDDEDFFDSVFGGDGNAS